MDYYKSMNQNDFPPGHHVDFSIIIPAFNEADFLPHTLDALGRVLDAIAAEKDLQGEVIVVDNNSSDETGRIAGEHPLAKQCLRVVFEPINQISKARNAGARCAASPLLIFVDADTVVSAAAVGAALNALTNDAVGGGARIKIDFKHRGGEFVTAMWNRFAGWAKYAAGCFVFCRKDAFEAVGGFSEEVYASEEIWLARALKKWGKQHAKQFVVLDEHVITSGRKLRWLSSFAMLKQAVVILFFPFALKYRRFCGAWYQRPDKSV